MQLLGFFLTYIVDSILKNINTSTIIPIFIGIFFLVFSMGLSCYLAIKWCKTKKAALITCILLPTNYTWFILLGGVVYFINVLIDILEKIPPNFG